MKTRQTSILLAFFMVFGLILSTGVIYAKNDFQDAVKDTTAIPSDYERNKREVVFLIDRSMYNSSLANIKNQVTALSSELIKTGNVSITLIAFNGNANTLVKKTNDVEKIENAFRYITPFGFSNPALALEIANSLEYANTKDVVLFTSIYPNIGSIEKDGPYTPKDHFYFRNANTFRNTAVDLSRNTRLITVSDFSKLNNKDYSFATRIFKENSDRYYSADQITNDELVDSLKCYILDDEVHETNLDKKPIIFVPGVAGSELFNIDPSLLSGKEKTSGMISPKNEKNMKMIYPPIGYDSKKVTEDLSLDTNDTLYTFQQGDLRNVPSIKRHAGPFSQYTPLLKNLMMNFPDRPVYLFSYDWRKTNVDSAEKLGQFIDKITDGGKVKVDLIAHSMGGIISAIYLKDNDDKVDKYLSFGTPYEGAPTTHHYVANSILVNSFIDSAIKAFTGLDTRVVSSFVSMVELFPAKRMLEKYPMQFVDETNQKEFLRAINGRHKTYEELIQNLSKNNLSKSLDLEESDLALARGAKEERYKNFLDVAAIFRENGERDGNIMLMHRPNSMFFAGNNHPTVVSGYFVVKSDKSLSNVENILAPEGDGVVPLYSATMGMTFEEMTPEIRNKFRVVNGDHMGMLSDRHNFEMMCDFLNGREVR